MKSYIKEKVVIQCIEFERQDCRRFDWSLSLRSFDFWGTIELPRDERAATEIDWDSDVPEYWEQVEEVVEDYLSDALADKDGWFGAYKERYKIIPTELV